MEENQKQTSPQDVGDVIELSRSQLRARGASDAPDVKQKIRLSDEIDDLLNSVTASRCGFNLALDVFDAETRTKLETLCAVESVTSPQIVRLLKKHGVDVSVHMVRRHRTRASGNGCRCDL